MPDADTQRLTVAMAAGDPAAVAVFYRRWFPFLLAAARRASGRDEAFCLDVVQEATLRVVRTVRPADTERQLRAWLRLVVQTTALDLLRRDQRRARHEAAAEPAASAAACDCDDRLAWVRAQVARFDPDLARMVEWRYEHGWTLQRIAGRLGLSIGTVDGRLRRAVGELRGRAAEAFDE